MKYLTGHESPGDILELVTEGRQMLLSVSAMEIILKSVAVGQLTLENALHLADALECELVDYENCKQEVIAQALFELSSSEINAEVTPERCMKLVALLESPDSATS